MGLLCRYAGCRPVARYGCRRAKGVTRLPALDRGEPSKRFRGEVLSAKDPLGEIIEVVPPLGRVVAVAVDVPDVRDTLLLEVGVHALADAEQAVLVAAGDPEQPDL